MHGHAMHVAIAPRTRDALEFLVIWALLVLLAVAIEVGGLYLLEALR